MTKSGIIVEVIALSCTCIIVEVMVKSGNKVTRGSFEYTHTDM